MCVIIIYSDQYHLSLSPLLRFALCEGPCVLVQYIAVNNRFYLLHLKKELEMISFSLQSYASSKNMLFIANQKSTGEIKVMIVNDF